MALYQSQTRHHVIKWGSLSTWFSKRVQNAPYVLMTSNTVAFWGKSHEPDMYIWHCLFTDRRSFIRKEKERIVTKIYQWYFTSWGRWIQGIDGIMTSLFGVWHRKMRLWLHHRMCYLKMILAIRCVASDDITSLCDVRCVTSDDITSWMVWYRLWHHHRMCYL